MEDLREIMDYVCSNLNSWSSNRLYRYEEFNICKKNFGVCEWRKKKALQPVPKKRRNYMR